MDSYTMLCRVVAKLPTVPSAMLGTVYGLLEALTGTGGEDKWLPQLKKFLRQEPCWLDNLDRKTADNIHRKIVPINRDRFNPEKFIGKGWSIVEDETDPRSKALTELDLTKVQHVTMLKNGETHIKGEEKLRRLKASDYIRLDADIFLTLWENQRLIPESWKEKVNGNTRFIYFDGTILRGSGGDRYALCLYWNDGAWDWLVHWLGFGWSVRGPAAVLAS